MVDQGPHWLSPAHCRGRKERGEQKVWAGREGRGEAKRRPREQRKEGK